MPLTKTKVTLSDGQDALKVEGISPDPIYLRVRLTRSEIKNGDTVMAALAYAVDPYGVTLLTGFTTGPECGMTLHQSGPNLQASLLILSRNAQTSFINAFTAQAQLATVAENLPI